MQVAIRTDASLDIGTGHVMRCLTLADALREHGAHCRFVCRAQIGNLLSLIRLRGYTAHVLPLAEVRLPSQEAEGNSRTAYDVWLGAHWATDADQTCAALEDLPVDWLIVDHYAIDARWEGRLQPLCQRLMVIDDLANRAHDCDLLLDQNLGHSTSDYLNLVNAGCAVLTGPEYALLRPEFAALRPYSLARRMQPELKRLLIALGGVDNGNATSKVLKALQHSSLPVGCLITVVMGPHAPWLAQVRDNAAKLPWKTEVLVNVSDMARLMAGSDLAIGAAGTSAWERCCLGLPTLVVVLAENQRGGARALQSAGAISLIDGENGIESGLTEQIFRYVRPEALEDMQRACCSITDGSGTSQIVEVLTNERH